MSVQPLPSPSYYPSATLTKPKDFPGVFLLELHARPDNRLSNDFILETVVPALTDVEREFRASRANDLAPASDSSSGWTKPNSPGEYALVTCGPTDKNRFYSNGLNLESAAQTEGFFQYVLGPMYIRLLTFPIPTVCALNGHAYAAGFVLALCHDHRVMKEGEAKGRATMAMNEVEFGAPIPVRPLVDLGGMYAALTERGKPTLMTIIEAKAPTRNWARKILADAHRLGAAQSLEIGIVDKLAPEAAVVDEACKLAHSMASRATTGVYGMIKAELYKDTVRTASLAEPQMNPPADDEMRRLKLGDDFAAKSKL